MNLEKNKIFRTCVCESDKVGNEEDTTGSSTAKYVRHVDTAAVNTYVYTRNSKNERLCYRSFKLPGGYFQDVSWVPSYFKLNFYQLPGVL